MDNQLRLDGMNSPLGDNTDDSVDIDKSILLGFHEEQGTKTTLNTAHELNSFLMSKNISFGIGPSDLIKRSGNTTGNPRPYDYHTNLEKDIRHNLASPDKYNLPNLFENNALKTDKRIVKNNPNARFT